MKIRRRRTDITRSIIGLDLSLRSTAACWIPPGWEGDINAVIMTSVGQELTKEATNEQRIERILAIADHLVAFYLKFGADAVYIEEYAFAAISSRATELHELGGVVKLKLFEVCGFAPQPVTASTCRKTLLQKLPKKDQKQFTEDNVRSLRGDALYWNGDMIDAFCVANHGLKVEGGIPLSFEGKVFEKEKKRKL